MLVSDNEKGNPYHDEEGKFTSKFGKVVLGGKEIDKWEDLLDICCSEEELEMYKNASDEEKQIIDEYLKKSYDDLVNQSKESYDILSDIKDNGEIIDELDDEEVSVGLNNIPFLDKGKISDLSIEEKRKLLKCLNIISQKQTNEELLELNKNVFYDLWIDPVTPSDYENKKDKIANKLLYFQVDYQKEDKEKKIESLKKFEELGKKYSEILDKTNSSYKEVNEYVEKFTDDNYAYSQQRKDNAVWIQNGDISKSIKEFWGQSKEVLDKVKKVDHKIFDDVVSYTGGYSSINNPLRGKYKYSELNPEKKHQFFSKVKNITYAIDQSTYDKDIWVQRGVSQIKINDDLTLDYSTSEKKLNDLVGKSFVDHGFLSCGAAKNTGFTSSSVIMNIYCPKGTKMLYVQPISYYETENEMIIQRGYSYNIKKAYRKNGKTYIDVDVVLGSDSQKYDDKKLEELSKYF